MGFRSRDAPYMLGQEGEGTESGRSRLVVEYILRILAREEHSEAVLWKAFWELGRSTRRHFGFSYG